MLTTRLWVTAIFVSMLWACGGGEEKAASEGGRVSLQKTSADLIASASTAVKNMAAGVNNVAAVTGNLVTNPGFENGGSGWTQTSTAGYSLISAFSGQTANSGTQIAWLGGYNGGTDTLAQDIQISGTGTQARLQFWYKISSSELTDSTAYDTFAVALYNPTTGAKLATLATFSNLDAPVGWIKSPQYDLSAYMGQRVQLRFTAVLDESASSSMLIDDLAVTVQDYSTITPQNGWWWNPAEGGRGFAIERQGNQIFLAAFLYEPSGSATWFVSTLTQQGNGSYTGALSQYSGGQTLLGAYKSPAVPTTIGSAVLTFDSPSTGTLDILQADGATIRSIAIERFPISSPAFATPGANFESGWWWNEAQGGRGFFVEVQGTQAFIGGFMYDAAGQPIWYVSTANLQGSQAIGGALQQYGGGQTLTGSFKAASVVSSAIGNIAFSFNSGSTGTMTLPNGSTVAMKRFAFNASSGMSSGGSSSLASFAGTYTISTAGLTVSFDVDANGNVTRCRSGALLVCSGSVNANGAFTVRGNDGQSPIDTTATATGAISATGSVTGTYTGNSVSDGPLSGSFTGTRIALSGVAAPSYQTAYDTCYVGTPILYTSIYCNAYANAMVAGSTAESANQAGANAAGSNVGNVGTGQLVSALGTPNTGGTSTVTCAAPKVIYNNACVTPVASLAFNKTELSYAPQANGTASAAQSVTLINTGNAGILLKISLSVPPLAQWNVVNTNCPSGSVVFAAGSSCTISINFTPHGDDSKLAAYTLQQSQGLNPSPIPNDLYTGTYEVWGDSVTTPQIAVPKATVLLSASGVYPVSSTPPSSGGTPSFASMATSGTWTYFGITATGELWGWGRNNKGQLGDGTTNETNKPKLIGSGYASVAGGFGGEFYVMAVKKDGSLMYWGGDIFNSGAANVLTPKVIGSGFAKVAPSTYSQAAIKTDGSLWVWGLNSSGLAGDGTRNPISAPKQIGTGYSTVSVGTTHRMAVKLDGSLWAWGSPTCGALSSAIKAGSPDVIVPTQIGTGYKDAVAFARYSTIALKADGSLWSWGQQYNGQLGDGVSTASCRATPQQIGTGFTAIAGGYEYAMALKADGTVWSWGHLSVSSNLTGADSLVPRQIGSGFAKIYMNTWRAYGIAKDGSLWSWGDSHDHGYANQFVYSATPVKLSN